MSPTTQRIPPAGPVELSSIANSTSAAAPEGTFCHRSGGLTSAPSQVYWAGIAPLITYPAAQVVRLFQRC